MRRERRGWRKELGGRREVQTRMTFYGRKGSSDGLLRAVVV
jgi:hypothetical protein